VSFAKEPPSVHVTVGPLVTPTLSVAVRVDDPVPPEATSRVAGLKVTTGGAVSAAIIIDSVAAVLSFPAASVAVAVHVAVAVALTSGALYMLFAKEPSVHVTVGTTMSSTLSMAVTVTGTVLPDCTERVGGLKVTTGASVSCGAVMETVNAPRPVFPAASSAAISHLKLPPGGVPSPGEREIATGHSSLRVAAVVSRRGSSLHLSRSISTERIKVPVSMEESHKAVGEAPLLISTSPNPTTPTLSVTTSCNILSPPEGGMVSAEGLRDTTGGSVSLATEIVSVSVPSFPAASVAVAAHVTSVSTLTTGAV